MARHKTGIALLLAFAGLAWWYMRRITRNVDSLKTKHGETMQAYGLTPIRSRRGNVVRKERRPKSNSISSNKRIEAFRGKS